MVRVVEPAKDVIAAGLRETIDKNGRRRVYDPSAFSPLVELSFKTAQDIMDAWDLVPAGKAVVGLPDNGIVADIPLVERIKIAGIPVYPSGVPLDERFEQPIDLDDLLEEMREMQAMLLFGE